MRFPEEVIQKIKQDINLLGPQFHPGNIHTPNAIEALLVLFNPSFNDGVGFRCPYTDCGHKSKLEGIARELFYYGFTVPCLKCRRLYGWKTVTGLEVETTPQQTVFIALAHAVGMSAEERNRRMLNPPPKVDKEALH